MAKKKPDPENLPSLVIEYRVSRGKDSAALTKLHALEDWLDALLRKHKLGDCDGGSIGSGTMEVFCDVTDYARAKALVLKAMNGAAYVAAVDSNGNHMVVTLDYLEKAKPDLAAFRKMKALVLTHHDWEEQVEVTVEGRPTKPVLARTEVVGYAVLKFGNVDIGLHKGTWVNWKQKPDRITREINRETPSYRDKGAGKYLSNSGGEWRLTAQVKLQRRWDAKPGKKAKR